MGGLAGGKRLSGLLLLLIGLVSPWVVHLAPPRQRPLALVGVVAVLLLFAIFATNPILAWQMWAGLAAGVVSILAVTAMSGGGGLHLGRGGGSRRPSTRPRRDQEDLTGEV